MGDAVSCSPYLADSSSGSDAPKLGLSRKKQHRVRLRVGSAALLKRERLWKGRVAKRLKDASISVSSSDEDNLTSSRLHTTILHSTVQRAAVQDTFAKSEVRAAFKRLPRPSEVVPDLDAGSASDAGCDKKLKEAHKRRVKSTEISIQYLNREGTQDPVAPWTLDLAGLKRYTRYMFPPPEDQNLRAPRVPLAFLSRSYRGTLLKTRKVGSLCRNQNKKRVLSKGTAEAQNGPFEVISSDHDSIADFEYWQTIKDVGIQSGLQTPQQPRSQQNAEQNERHLSNKELLSKVLAENESGSSGSEDGEKNSSIGSTPHSPPPAQPEQGPPAVEEKDHLGELLKMLHEDPNTLFAETPKSEPTAVTPVSGDEGEVEEVLDKDDSQNGNSEKILSEFELEKRKGKDFCASGSSSLKRSRSGLEMEILKLEPTTGKAKLNGPAEARKSESNQFGVSSQSLRMMEKMGFKGRLGAKEDGILEPIRAKETRGRHGLGLRTDRDVVMGKPMTSIPSSFKGKVVETVELDPNTSTAINEDVSDVFSGRKGTVATVAEGNARASKSSLVAALQTKKTEDEDLDDEEEFETDQEDSIVDNGRRAILIDIDALMKNGRERRTKAFRQLFENPNAGKKSSDWIDLLSQQKRDFCDSDCISMVLDAVGLEESGVSSDQLQDDLDKAFREGEEPEWDVELIEVLKYYSKDTHFGFLHIGSRGRLNHEISSLRISHSFLNGARVTIQHGEDWPYTATWQNLLCRVGVRARQAIFMVNQKNLSDRLIGGVVAGSVLGARAMVMSRTEHALLANMFDSDVCGEVKSAVIGKDHEILFDRFVKDPRSVIKRRRVIGFYSADGLWYAGRQLYGEQDSSNQYDGSSLIRFYGYENEEWVEKDNVFSLTRRNYRKLRDADFGGMFDPGDVENM